VPELPEVETLRRDLLLHLPDERVAGVEVLRSDSVGYPADPAVFSKQMIGQVFSDRMLRRGKYLLLYFKQGTALGVHLRMSGRLLWRRAEAPLEPHARVRIPMASGHELRFEDMRVFGRLWLIPVGVPPERVMGGLARLGPEPFAEMFDGQYLAGRFAGRNQPVKSALLDQQLVAGVGNIYADEALFSSGIHPALPVGGLDAAALERLHRAVVKVLEAGIAQRGATLRNYTDAQGMNGNYAGTAWVYGRKGQPCRVCHTPIERIRLAGRSTHFCPTCQCAQQSVQ
jgi:formamidopyrimidine-DNA glycosylase